MAGAWCLVPLLLLGAGLGRGQPTPLQPGVSGLRHSYDCGAQGLQLLVYPPPGQTIHFRVVDEFGNRFEVNNCSVCYHWVTSRPRGPVVFSADYRGCHVLEKDSHWRLRVSVETALPDGRVAESRDITLTCPKPGFGWALSLHRTASPASSGPSTPPTQPLLPSPSLPAAEPRLLSASRSQEPGPTHPSPPSRPPGGTQAGWDVDGPVYGVPPALSPASGTHQTQKRCQLVSGHIPCLETPTQEACQRAGCCYDDTREVPCYYGNTETVQCFADGRAVLVVSQDTAAAHRVTLGSIRLAGAPHSCPPVQQTESFLVFSFSLTHCNTTLQLVGNQLIYENLLVSDKDVQTGPQGSITRDGTFRLLVRCIFKAQDFLPIQASVFPPPPPGPVTQSGPLRLELRIAKDETFSSFFEDRDYPIVRLLRQPVPVEVRLLQRTDPSLVLALDHCWATPSASPFQQPQWPILLGGCPYLGDSYQTQMVPTNGTGLPFPCHHQRFTVATFALLDSTPEKALRGLVYFFCSASVSSHPGPQDCAPLCQSENNRRRRSSGPRDDTAGPQNIVSSLGPVGFEDASRQEPTPEPAGSPGNPSWNPPLWLFLLLLAATLVLGVGVLGGLRQARKLWEGSGR
ncbi:zona pellucida sperm-binding protein 1 [Sorex araneus]|uniref:zona pellucida sperm-binding protein 1 n=1 Tax=Sorex araneus TaxID=42254 RepID=UPI00243357DF|nr:zona pellucida sperm-binding protein 1 [Sorex araneus]